MSTERFSVDISKLGRKTVTEPQGASAEPNEKIDRLADELGFGSREPSRETSRGGRRPSPRTGQIHAKVLPNVAKEIAEMALARGVQQGVIIEEAWEIFKRSMK